MSYKFKSNAIYSDGQSVNEVLNILEDKYNFLKDFDNYVTSRFYEFEFDYNSKFPKDKFNEFLTKVFKDYITFRIHGIQTKADGISFIDSGLLISTTKVSYISDNTI